ncbi:hypothetical protein GW17_00038668 [Ensete ventricosum]|nr:hypothetical protein GW17_00038668 [Ensete ventricosum]
MPTLLLYRLLRSSDPSDHPLSRLHSTVVASHRNQPQHSLPSSSTPLPKSANQETQNSLRLRNPIERPLETIVSWSLSLIHRLLALPLSSRGTVDVVAVDSANSLHGGHLPPDLLLLLCLQDILSVTLLHSRQPRVADYNTRATECNRNRASSASSAIVVGSPLPTIEVPSLSLSSDNLCSIYFVVPALSWISSSAMPTSSFSTRLT